MCRIVISVDGVKAKLSCNCRGKYLLAPSLLSRTLIWSGRQPGEGLRHSGAVSHQVHVTVGLFVRMLPYDKRCAKRRR